MSFSASWLVGGEGGKRGEVVKKRQHCAGRRAIKTTCRNARRPSPGLRSCRRQSCSVRRHCEGSGRSGRSCKNVGPDDENRAQQWLKVRDAGHAARARAFLSRYYGRRTCARGCRRREDCRHGVGNGHGIKGRQRTAGTGGARGKARQRETIRGPDQQMGVCTKALVKKRPCSVSSCLIFVSGSRPPSITSWS